MSDSDDDSAPSPPPPPPPPTSTTLPSLSDLGRMAHWSVSSHKYGFGVDNLRDGNENTFWQSEGPQPHCIDLSFPRRVFITSIGLLTSHPRDDSYTPSKISIRAGTSVHDLQEVRFEEFKQPDGWIVIPLSPVDMDDLDGEGSPEGMRAATIPAHHLRIVIVANHLNGKDTHVRGLKVFGPPENAAQPMPLDPEDMFPSGPALLALGHDGSTGFTTTTYKMHAGIR